MPAPSMLHGRASSNEIPAGLYPTDIHGKPEWRRHMTLRFAEEIRAELLAPPLP